MATDSSAPAPKSLLAHGAVARIFSYFALVAASLVALVPLWHILVAALAPTMPAGATSWHWPAHASMDNFVQLATETGFVRWLANSLLVSLAVTLVGVALSATAGYALSRFHFFGRLTVLRALLVTQIFPATMLLLPIFLVLVKLRLTDTFFGLILVYLATILPFCIWQMKNFYDTIPESLEEAAAMDGCTPGQTFLRVVLPVSASGLAVTALFSFAAAWNEYVVAAILLQDSSLFTLPLGLRMLHTESLHGQPGIFAAGALVVTVPVLVLYLALSRFLVARLRDITLRN
ncbi:MAG: carbohydrate ABC transporter permease [Chthoniobacterales bacterium]|nr:carbohydrate ABC transporter permease [Chthoniobacterales bacterium]